MTVSAPSAQAQDAVPIDAGDALELVEMLIGQDPSRYATPLAAMHGRAELYTKYRDLAQQGDPMAQRVWLLLGDYAVQSVDASLMQSYAADLLPAYAQDPKALLAALKDAPWLAPSTCRLLSAHFGSEDRPEEGRIGFLESERDRIAGALPARIAQACLQAIENPE
ncbi:hypothetical protein MWU54_06215 [Marivita sp. S6314]|uniref:hypothetical protein n=1 Tax=Marivita sp. S6314 TaxID=2926406 RepID=UPI001FF2FA62|nr:hypothetical protein [Marivita sp. S6314]MCK0149608.1 hypothetical protein [Marivita sp. S6314]